MSGEWRVEVFSDLRQVPGEDWSMDGKRPFHQSLDFLSALALSEVENAEYRYVICYAAGKPVGSAIISRFMLQLDLLAGQSWLTRIKKWLFPKWLCAPMICCGIPASFGQSSVHVTDPSLWPGIIEAIDYEMQVWAQVCGTGLLVWKEFPDGHPGAERLMLGGYAVLPTLPDYRFTALPSTIPAFMETLRSAYRRKFRQVLTLFEYGIDQEHSGLRFSRKKYDRGCAHSFYEGYRALMARTPVKLEQYGPDFFRNLDDVRQFELALLALSSDSDRVEALLVDDADDRYLILVSKSKAIYEDNLYGKLLRLIVLDAVQEGKKRLFLGQTSDYAKSVLGAGPVRLVTAIRFLRPWRQKIFARYGHWLFPERVLPRHRVFRSMHLEDHPHA
jgi:hypothetical protein